MSSNGLDPVEANLVENLHRCDWIIENESTKEYGRIFAAAKKQHFGSILEDTFLHRLDEAKRIQRAEDGWIAISTLLVPVQQDLDIFKWIIGLDDSEIAIDDGGRFYVTTDCAINILRSDRDILKGRISKIYGLVVLLVLFLVAAVVFE